MKSFLLLLCSVFIFGFSASELGHFKIKNGQIVWQKVYDTDLTKKQLIEVMKTSGYFDDITIVNEKKLTARINQLSPDHLFPYKSMPFYIKSSHIKAFAIIELKDKQFRFTLKSIRLIGNYNSTDVGGIIEMDIERIMLNKDYTFRDKLLKKHSKILDFTFQKITNLNKIEEEEDTW